MRLEHEMEWLVKMVGWSSLRILRDFFEIFKDFIIFKLGFKLGRVKYVRLKLG